MTTADEDWQDFVASLDEFGETMEEDIRYEHLEQEGPPVAPLEFPTPIVFPAQMVSVKALDHRNGNVRVLENVLMRCSSSNSNNRGFLVRKKIAKTTYGSVRVAVVLRKRDEDDGSIDDDVHWISTEELVAVKIASWTKLRQFRGTQSTAEDPLREVAALQYVGNYNPHVVGCIETLQDDKNLYTIMPYCNQGTNLHGKLFAEPETTNSTNSNTSHNSTGSTNSNASNKKRQPNEDDARKIFRQLLKGLQHLQRKGIFHRDISLDNLLISRSNQLRIIDLGMSLRVPYSDPCNEGMVTDVSEGTIRRLLKPQGKAGGRLMYLAPELLAETMPLDGFAVDLWAAGVILFVLCVGLAPFKFAEPRERRYAKISSGGLKSLMKNLRISISPEACDLLQNMLWEDPRHRLTLNEVMRHPWVMNSHNNNANEKKMPSMLEQQPPKLPVVMDNAMSSDVSMTSQSSTEPAADDNINHNSKSSTHSGGGVAGEVATLDDTTNSSHSNSNPAEAREAGSEQRDANFSDAMHHRLKNLQRIGPKVKHAITKSFSGGSDLQAMSAAAKGQVGPDRSKAPTPPNDTSRSPQRRILKRLGIASSTSSTTNPSS